MRIYILTHNIWLGVGDHIRTGQANKPKEKQWTDSNWQVPPFEAEIIEIKKPISTQGLFSLKVKPINGGRVPLTHWVLNHNVKIEELNSVQINKMGEI